MIKILKSKGLSRIFYIAIALVIVSFVLISAINFAAGIIEMNEIGYKDVYYKNLTTKIVTGTISFAILFVLFGINLFIVRKNLFKIWGTPPVLAKAGRVYLLTTIFAFAFTMVITPRLYPLYLQFYSSVPFNAVDPIMGQDIGYYVFQRPFLSEALNLAESVLFFQIVYSFIIYAISYLRTDFLSFKEIFKEKRIINHIVLHTIVWFIILASSFKFTTEDVLLGKFGELSGAGFTEIMVWFNFYRVAPFILIAIVIMTAIFIKMGKLKLTVISVLIVPVMWAVVFATSFIVEQWFVKPYEVSMQRYYIQHNLDATKRAFNLNTIEEKEFLADTDLTLKDIEENKSVIDNIRITDITQTLQATNSLQSLRSFYTFTDNDIITYDIGGKKTPLMISVREVDESKLQQSSKSYINKKLRYTHGYGIVANPSNAITEEGQPDYIIKNIPSVSLKGAPEITEPRIYFGELTDDYIITGTKYNELDYMEGDKTYEYSYSGKAGIPLNFLNRVIFSVNKLDPMILISGYITNESKILPNRDIMERVKKAAPFLTYDSDPYIVIDDGGKLKWVIDIYTSTDLFPYSQTYNGINYIRNSAKAVVDAYDGTVTFYITDIYDPIINVVNRMYPTLFSTDTLPHYIASQAHYPEYLFKIQAEVYKKYHVSEPEALYSNSDVWVTAKEKYSQDETVDVAPYYNLMNLNGEGDLVLMQPYTPQGKENLVSWIAASSLPGSYGKLTAYKFPKGKTVYGTLHIENKIDNDPNISKEISLWDQGGSKVIKGNLLVIPIKDSLLYVEPIYITAKNSAALPEVKRVVVAFGDKVAMEPTLKQSLDVLFGVRPSSITGDGTAEKTIDELIDEAVKKYNEMQGYTSSGDFKAFGGALDELGNIIKQIEEKTAPAEQTEEIT